MRRYASPRPWTGIRDLLLASSVALVTLGPGIAAALDPGWHVGGFLGGIELLFFILVAFPAGLVLSGIAAAPPSRWFALRALAIRGAVGAAVLAPLVMFAFRAFRGLPFSPYSHGCSCSSSSPSHVMVLAMFVMPMAAFLLGASAGHGVALVWRRLSTRMHFLARVGGTMIGVGLVTALAWPLMGHSALSFLAVCTVISLLPLASGDRRLTAATLVTLGSAILLGTYM